jgi:hypothetical protein
MKIIEQGDMLVIPRLRISELVYETTFEEIVGLLMKKISVSAHLKTLSIKEDHYMYHKPLLEKIEFAFLTRLSSATSMMVIGYIQNKSKFHYK